jgi:hypothetical protein
MNSITTEGLATPKAIVIALKPDETLSIVKKDRESRKPNYMMVGNGTMNKHKIFGIDLLRELVESSAAGQFLILKIKDGICFENGYSHVVNVSKSTLSGYEQKMLRDGFKELKAREIVRRVKNGWYMINPNALIPSNYEQAIIDWENAK